MILYITKLKKARSPKKELALQKYNNSFIIANIFEKKIYEMRKKLGWCVRGRFFEYLRRFVFFRGLFPDKKKKPPQIGKKTKEAYKTLYRIKIHSIVFYSIIVLHL